MAFSSAFLRFLSSRAARRSSLRCLRLDLRLVPLALLSVLPPPSCCAAAGVPPKRNPARRAIPKHLNMGRFFKFHNFHAKLPQKIGPLLRRKVLHFRVR